MMLGYDDGSSLYQRDSANGLLTESRAFQSVCTGRKVIRVAQRVKLNDLNLYLKIDWSSLGAYATYVYT